MSWRGRRAVWRGSRWAAAAAVALVIGACSRPGSLIPNRAVEAVLSPGEKAQYQLDSREAEAYTHLLVAVRPVEGVTGEVTVRVVAPGDRLVAEAAGVNQENGRLLAWVGAVGRYRIEIENLGSGIPAAYRLEVTELRAARSGDLNRAAAVRNRSEADRLAAGGDRNAALGAFDRSIEHWLRAGEIDAALDVLFDRVGFDYGADPDAALSRCHQALKLSTEAGLPARRIQALNWTGTILMLRKRDCQAAFAAYDQGRGIARENGELEWAAEMAFSVAALQRRCAPEDAETAFEAAIAAAREAGRKGIEAQSYLELAIMAKHRGDLEAARDRIEHAWRLAQRSGDLAVEADVAHERGNLDRRQGRLTEALESYQRCLQINEQLRRSDLLPDVLLSLGALALELRRPEEAWAYNDQALSAAESLGDLARESIAQVGLGAVLQRKEDYTRAEEAFRRALAAAERLEAGSTRTRRIAAARFRLGSALFAERRSRDAVSELTAALEAQRAVGDRIGETQTRQVLGAALGRLGEVAAATEQLSTALALNRELGDPLRTVGILYHLAKVEALADPQRGRRTIEEAIAISQRVRAGLSRDPLRTGFSEASRRLYELYVDLLVGAGDANAAFAASEQSRARGLLDLLAEARIDLAAGVAPGLRDELQAIDERIAWLRHRLDDAAAAANAEQKAVLREEIERAEQEWWRVEAAIRERSPKYDAVRGPPIAGVAEVQARLPPGRALLEYWLGDENALVFVVTRKTFDLVPLPASRTIESDVAALRSAALSLEPPSRFSQPAHRLYQDLVAPALASAALSAAEPIEELVIIPDGPLNLLPFEALITGVPAPGAGFADLAYLLRAVSISYAPSASVLASLEGEREIPESRSKSRLRVVAFADPSYDRGLVFDCPEMGGRRTEPALAATPVRSQRLERLSGSRSEVRAIADRYGSEARVYFGSDASEDRMKTDPELATADRIHLAVHGVVCESLPEQSGLVFALDGGGDDGILQIREIFGLDLSADLVVLSACETGLGRLVSGEGMVGMARAFFYAGTPALVVSLWQVSDRSTSRLMASFYEQLDLGVDKATALQRARLALVEAGGPHAAPFYWAPFVLLGSRDVGTPTAPAVTREAL